MIPLMPPPIKACCEEAAQRWCVTLEDLFAGSRLLNHVHARHDAWRAIEARGWSTRQIAQTFKCNHSSVVRALGKRRKKVAVKGRAA